MKNFRKKMIGRMFFAKPFDEETRRKNLGREKWLPQTVSFAKLFFF